MRDSPILVGLRLADPGLRRRLEDGIAATDAFSVASPGRAADILVLDADNLDEAARRSASLVILGEVERRRGNIRALLPADADAEMIVDALRLVVSGLLVLPDEAVPAGAPGAAPDSGDEAPAVALTRREQEVFDLLAAGASNKAIARRLGISVHTVKFHVASILDKLGASSRLEAVGIGLRNGLLLV